MQTVEVSRMERAGDKVEGWFQSQAKERLIATFINSEIKSTHCNKRLWQISNRTKMAFLGSFISSRLRVCFHRVNRKGVANPPPACTLPTAALECFTQSNCEAQSREAPSDDITSRNAAPRRIPERAVHRFLET